MTTLNPPPQRVPKNILQDKETRNFFKLFLRSLYQIWYAIGGQNGVPTIFQVTGTPAIDPGFSSSSTIDMNDPDGFYKITVDGIERFVPFWDA